MDNVWPTTAEEGDMVVWTHANGRVAHVPCADISLARPSICLDLGTGQAAIPIRLGMVVL